VFDGLIKGVPILKGVPIRGHDAKRDSVRRRGHGVILFSMNYRINGAAK